MREVQTQFRTHDLTLATVLAMHNLTHADLIRDSSGQAEWLYVEADCDMELLCKVVAEYESGKMRLEPRRFMRELRATRDGLYEFLDGDADGR